MKYLITALLFCLIVNHSSAQNTSKHKPIPKAKKYNDSAFKLFTTAEATPKIYATINKLLDEAVRIDPKYYDGWANLVTYLGRIEKYDQSLAASLKMCKLFPESVEARYNTAILNYKVGHVKEAMEGFQKLYKSYSDQIEKTPKGHYRNDLVLQKCVLLILLDRSKEGKDRLRNLYDEETDPYKKSYIAFYVNKTKQEILEDRLPGR